jgi:hypothetical protein
MAQPDYYRVLLDREWGLVDLYEFPHAYAQNYAFIYCLDTDHSPRDVERINRAIREYPWQGGYSYVNIYTVLQNQVPQDDRPTIKSISKSSPGWLDLFLNVDVAISVAKSVAVLSGAAVAASAAYKRIHKALGEAGVNRRKHQLQLLQITHGEAKVLNSMCLELAKFLGFKRVHELHEKTGDPEVTLKLLLAHFRRIEKLTEYVDSGKAELPTVAIDSDGPRGHLR